MISEKMQKALNDQIQAEMFSSYLYLSMSACFNSVNMDGMAQWMKVQSREENGHAMKIYSYLIERGGKVELQAIEKPQTTWATPLDAFKDAYKHELYITGRINDLVKLAYDEGDIATLTFLQWFVTEQVEEEANASKIVAMLEMIGESKNGLFMMDHNLGKRE
ncbi:TPA: ferritin [bacterium]|nr:ferritin [bacterium]